MDDNDLANVLEIVAKHEAHVSAAIAGLAELVAALETWRADVDVALDGLWRAATMRGGDPVSARLAALESWREALAARVGALEVYRFGADRAGHACGAALADLAARVDALEAEYSGPNWRATILAHDARLSALEDQLDAPAQHAPLPCQCAECEQERDLVEAFAAQPAPLPAAWPEPVADAVAVLRSLGKRTEYVVGEDRHGVAGPDAADALAAHARATTERDARLAQRLRSVADGIWTALGIGGGWGRELLAIAAELDAGPSRAILLDDDAADRLYSPASDGG